MFDRLKTERALVIAAAVFAAVNLSHGVDHVRQGVDRLGVLVMAAGASSALLAAITLVLILRRHTAAPVAAAVVGPVVFAGLAASHFAPHWSGFSDPYADAGVDALSWAIAITEAVAALILGLIGYGVMRDSAAWRRLTAPPTPTVDPSSG